MDANELKKEKERLLLERDVRRLKAEEQASDFMAKFKWPLLGVGAFFLYVLLSLMAR